MPGRVRALDRRYVRLSDSILGKVEHLARLAGVTVPDVVDYILLEAFDDGFPQDPPVPPPPLEARKPPSAAPPRRRSRLADVIPIDRARRQATPVTAGEPCREAPRLPLLERRDLAYLRKLAVDARGQARIVRAGAAAACDRAGSARALAQDVLEGARRMS